MNLYLLSTPARSTILARRTAWLRPASRPAGHEAARPSSRRRLRTASRRASPWRTRHNVVPPPGEGSSVTIGPVPSWNILIKLVKLTLLKYKGTVPASVLFLIGDFVLLCSQLFKVSTIVMFIQNVTSIPCIITIVTSMWYIPQRGT